MLKQNLQKILLLRNILPISGSSPDLSTKDFKENYTLSIHLIYRNLGMFIVVWISALLILPHVSGLLQMVIIISLFLMSTIPLIGLLMNMLALSTQDHYRNELPKPLEIQAEHNGLKNLNGERSGLLPQPKNLPNSLTHGSDWALRKLQIILNQHQEEASQSYNPETCIHPQLNKLCRHCLFFQLVQTQSENLKLIAGKKKVSEKHKTSTNRMYQKKQMTMHSTH